MRLAALGCLCVAACGGGSAGPDGGPPDAAGACVATRPLAESIFYHVYVRSYADSDGDGVGDLPGLTSRLDYIQSLGVDGVLLLPLFQDVNPEFGGYGTIDYGHVAAAYGGDAAWDSFVAAAHARCLRVVLDLSLTIVSTSHPWFAAAASAPSASERAHFLLHAPPCPTLLDTAMMNGWTAFPDGECYYSEYAPGPIASLNVRDAATADALVSVAKGWLDRGADGFRLDSAAQVAAVDPAAPMVKDESSAATHAFWRVFMQAAKQRTGSAFAVAELFASYRDYYADGIDMAFDYPVYFAAHDAWTQSHAGTGLGAAVLAQLSTRPPGLGALFVGNHDLPRIADLLCPAPCTSPTALRAAAQLLLALPGVPFVYYGEELGLHGAAGANGPGLWSRNPMLWSSASGRGFTSAAQPWTAFGDGDPDVAAEEMQSDSLLNTYRGLIAVRRRSAALTRGAYRDVPSRDPAVLAFLRDDAAEPVLVAINFATDRRSTTVDLAQAGITEASPHELIFGGALGPPVAAANAAAWPLPELAPSAAIWIALPR